MTITDTPHTAVSNRGSWPNGRFAGQIRTADLGRRHVGYGVTAPMYEPVGAALISTLRDTADVFGDEHEEAWTKLFGLVAETMLEGANASNS